MSNANKKILIEKNILIKFSDSDPQGICYFNQTLQIAHDCLEEFWANSKLGWNYWFKNLEFAVPIRHSECDYLKPMPVGQNFRVEFCLEAMGESSITFLCTIFDHKQECCAKALTTHVFVNKKNFQKMNIPESIHQFLS